MDSQTLRDNYEAVMEKLHEFDEANRLELKAPTPTHDIGGEAIRGPGQQPAEFRSEESGAKGR